MLTWTWPAATGRVPSARHGTSTSARSSTASGDDRGRSNGASIAPVYTASAPSPTTASAAMRSPNTTAWRSCMRRRRSARAVSGRVVTPETYRTGCSSHGQHARVQDRTLLEGRAVGAVPPVLQVEDALVLHDVGEQVAEEGRVLGEQGVEVEGSLGGDELVEAHLARGHLGPVPGGHPAVVRVGAPVTDGLEDHAGHPRGRAPGPAGPFRGPVTQSSRSPHEG